MTAPLTLLAEESVNVGDKFAVGFFVLAIFLVLLLITLVIGGGHQHRQ